MSTSFPRPSKTRWSISCARCALLERDATVLALGGDHSITLPLLRAHHARFGPLSVVHVDAHPDTWPSEFDGHLYSHGTSFRRAIEEGLIRKGGYIQIGIRGPTTAPQDLQEARDLGARVITIDEALEMGMPGILQEVGEKAQGACYLSFDIDAADPAFAPGTGTPEVGGFTSHQLLTLVRGLKGLELVGFDLVEVSPPYDHGGITAILAANLAFEMLSLIALRRAGTAQMDGDRR